MFRYQATRGKDGLIADQLITAGHQKPNGKIQDVHEESSVQNYDIGTRMVMDDRVFRYCRAGGALDPLLGGRADIMPREGAGDAVDYEVGEFVVTIPMNDEEAAHYAREKVAGYWNEGYYWSGIADPPTGQLYRIKSSAAAAAGVTVLTEGFVKLTLYEALKVRVPASTWVTAWANPYSRVIHDHSGRMSVVCQPLISVQSGYYFWGQTWGPCFGQQHNTKLGLADGDRMCYYKSDGSLCSSKDVTYTSGSVHEQLAGFLITHTRAWTNAGGSAENGGDQFYMLMLSP